MDTKTDKSKAGYVKIHRSMFDNPLFMKHPEYIGPWVWMIAQARFKANGIGRGQLELSLRFLRKKFPFFSHAKCQRFFDTLIDTKMIEIDTQADTRGRLVTICNYDKYQHLETEADTLTDTESQKTDTPTDTRLKKVKEGRKKEDIFAFPDEKADKNIFQYPVYFEQWWAAFRDKAKRSPGSKRDAFKAYQKAIKEVDHATLLEAVEQRRGSLGTDFNKDGCRWLKAAEWESAVQPPVQNAMLKTQPNFQLVQPYNPNDPNDRRGEVPVDEWEAL